jgi:type 1 glutamine amidotransferase
VHTLALIVVVTATAGFRHDSIETAEGVIAQIAAQKQLDIAFARNDDEMKAMLAPDALRKTSVVMFVNTTGEIAPSTRDTLLQWIANGGSFIGVHSASDTWHESPDYIEMLGGEFLTHPDQTTRRVFVERQRHPATESLESPHALFEEYYVLRNFHLDRVTMLLALHDPFQPLAWTKNYGSGRVLYTALGHRIDVWTSEWFQRHLSGALDWALRRDIGPRRRAVAR